MPLDNLFESIPSDLPVEVFEEILQRPGVRIERILSRGQSSPGEGWYDQDEHEWVLVLQGSARLCFDDGEERALVPGEHVMIPAHRRHRVAWTDPDQVTIWLAVFFTPEVAGQAFGI